MPRLDSLPVDALLPEIVERLRAAPALVLRAPTGSGKTTRVPPALEEAGFGPVVLLEPRRVAARAAARRMATERGERLGERFGYRVRFEAKVSARTRVTAVTEGVFLRKILADPLLDGVACVVFDEFHERHVDGDLALALARRVQRDVRPDLRIVVLSATLDPAPVAAFLDAEVVTSEGRLHPVDVEHRPPYGREPLEEQVARAAVELLPKTPGDLLVFLPGMGEIRRAESQLRAVARDVDIHVLHGDVDARAQDAALQRGARRRIVLATNIAESSVTVDGVSGVIDSGLARIPRFDARSGLDRLELGRISMESVRQRAGRAGRQGPGVDVRLWSAIDERAFTESVEPEIARVDVAGAWLSLLDFGERDPREFPWLEAPPDDASDRARDLLEALGATRSGALTDVGRELARLPLAPRLGRLLLAGRELGCLPRAALAAALVGERDPFRGGLDHLDAQRSVESDLLERVELLEDIEAGRSGPRTARGAARRIFAARDQLLRAVDARGGRATGGDEAFLRAVFVAFADRTACARSTERATTERPKRGKRPSPAHDAPGARLMGGRGVRLARECRVRSSPLFVCVDVDSGATEGLVRQASCVRREWLDPAEVTQEVRCEFDSERDVVRLTRATVWRGLEIAAAPGVKPDDARREMDGVDAAIERALAEAARSQPARAFDLAQGDFAQQLARHACYIEWTGGASEAIDADPTSWVTRHAGDLVAGRRSFKELRAIDLSAEWRARLAHAERVALDRAAPTSFALPSGRRASITYEPGRPPVIAARIQDFFGLDETPALCAGRVPVVLHLCAPNGRPEQITGDLAGFWRGTYALVRKDLRGRYPKHDWPEDPLDFEPRKRRRK